MELWISDRSEAYSSGTFDIHDEPDKFARALVVYATMDDDMMGLDTFIEREDGNRYITLDDASGEETRLRLDKLMIRQKAVVSRAKTCYKTRGSHVAKFLWLSDKRSGSLSMSTRHKSSADRTSGNASGSKRRRSSNTKPSLYTPGEDLWENRVYTCIIVSPAGRVISEFTTIKELLESERDAIKAHWSLYVSGKILHRNISLSKIIIANPETANGFKGMLVDLDLAEVRDSVPSGAQNRAGTLGCMAVEVLCKTDHTYRHDLESFFYVLTWISRFVLVTV
ncbi:hypothetical protein CFO_g3804 [Ceratocystis platani]|uniref:Fungal-type protein kinase domain-containing protein n=1 Tax=Ceratocystis fimbriata f. sp. platani TaxID=88771 RepID=A0A0F8BMX6_CERFI|nr:hypothetical protein CFO_g3804 [Ceratocystis platani]